METYTIKNLTFSYPMKEEKPVLNNICLNIEQGTFLLLCGSSGCGKSTFLRHLKTVLTPCGEKTGDVFFEGRRLEEIDQREQTSKIGYVLQNPDNQIVTDKVWHELAFGLESLGYENKVIRLRVGEMASFFGIQNWFEKDVTELSGGQKQLLNLASIMVMQPCVLILDEPTSQLDPIAAAEFLEMVKKVNMELGVTIIISEHRLEEAMPLSDQMVVMDMGEMIICEEPYLIGGFLKKIHHPMFYAMPSPVQVFEMLKECNIDDHVMFHRQCPMNVRDGRRWLDGLPLEVTKDKMQQEEVKEGIPLKAPKNEVLHLKNVYFRYLRKNADVIKNLSLKVYKGEVHAILGGNGTGKTTTLGLISGILKPYRGSIRRNGIGDKEKIPVIATLPQNPLSIFLKKTVQLDLLEMLSSDRMTQEEKEKKVKSMVELMEISHLLMRHPYDLSGGEQQRAALAKVMLCQPEILLLDEPTKGLDGFFKQKLHTIFLRLKEQGITIIMVSHDIEFCAKYADRCSLFFNGSVITENYPREFFGGNRFYTTSANRMARHIFPKAITTQEVIEQCQMNLIKAKG